MNESSYDDTVLYDVHFITNWYLCSFTFMLYIYKSLLSPLIVSTLMKWTNTQKEPNNYIIDNTASTQLHCILTSTIMTIIPSENNEDTGNLFVYCFCLLFKIVSSVCLSFFRFFTNYFYGQRNLYISWC